MPEARKRSERQRWTTIYTLHQSSRIEDAEKRHAEMYAIVRAFEKIGRVVRLEVSKLGYGNALDLKARKA